MALDHSPSTSPSRATQVFEREQTELRLALMSGESVNKTRVLAGIALVDMLAKKALEKTNYGFGITEKRRFETLADNISWLLHADNEAHVEPPLTEDERTSLTAQRIALENYNAIQSVQTEHTDRLTQNYYKIAQE